MREAAGEVYDGVTITETLQMTVEVEANSCAEAEEEIEDKWRACEYILDAECFKGVTFRAKQLERNEPVR